MSNPISPPSGIYSPHQLQKLCYGDDIVAKELLHCLPSPESCAVIVTGTSIATKTPLLKQVEDLLSPRHFHQTFSNIQQHAPVAQITSAVAALRNNPNVDTVISIGGGSPIDSAKAISYQFHELHGRFLTHIAIPTTLSAAECTDGAGMTTADGVKTGVRHPNLAPACVLYDPRFAAYTPSELFLSTGLRAVDHAVESQYNKSATWMPCRVMALQAVSSLFDLLPRYRERPDDADVILGLFLAAYGSLGFLGKHTKGPLGLSHTLGYALGSPYGIPHGITSCLTLGHVVKLQGRFDEDDARSVAAILPYLGQQRSDDSKADCEKVGDCILRLVKDLGLYSTLSQRGVAKDQVDIIVERGLGPWRSGMPGGMNGEYGLAVRELVEGLF
ncbi:hypothetical protein FE257_004232 [Aspergillus nanangensis]|uniref:Alcohol dehydrogenase iron-type/glycerol dehydrogenase GldA domain-containing protein n=1 Tax=Aspergillus nanangensis TaxID=2582783 RepID=A0AAD4CRF9_ASPNN|nr:hypothetical protein FE257_004232 [Aspergillus nanangensis]